jgi:hypothetical protein
MPGWLTALLKWGGSAVTIISVIAAVYVEVVAPQPTIISVIAAVYVEVVAPQPEGGWTVAHMPMTLIVVLIAAGLVAAIIGWSSGS